MEASYFNFRLTGIVFFMALLCHAGVTFSQPYVCSCKDREKIRERFERLSLENETDAINFLLGQATEGEAVCKAWEYELLASFYLNKKELDTAAVFLEQSVGFYKKTGCDDMLLLPVYKLFVSLYSNRSDYQPALDYSYKILAIAEKKGDQEEQAFCLLAISNIFNRMGQADKAIIYCRTAVPLVEILSPSVAKAELFNRIAARYIFYSQDFQDASYADTASVYLQKALTSSRSVNDRNGQIIAMTRMNTICEGRGEYDRGLAFLDSALELCIPGQNNRQLSTIFGDKGHVYMLKGSYSLARFFADSCLYYSRWEKFPPLIANAYSLIYEIEKSSGNYKDALWALENEKKISDSLNRAERIAAVNELEKKYNQAKNEKTITELNQETEIKNLQIMFLFIVIALALVLIIFLFVVYRQRLLRQKQELLQTEQRLQRSRINPHFFFNALTTLQGIAMKETDGKNLAMNLFKFSSLMRQTLESSYNDQVPISVEIDFLQKYIDLQQMKVRTPLIFNVLTDEKIDMEACLIPAMIIQPFIENSIEHGFNDSSITPRIDLSFSATQENLLVEIKDNGSGIKLKKEGKDHVSRATQIINDRIYLLNRVNKTRSSFSVESMETGSVIIKMTLPLIYIP